MFEFLLMAAPAAPPPPAAVVLVQEGESAQEAVDAILDEYEAKRREFFDAYRAAEDDAAREKVFEELYPKAAEYIPRLWKVIEAHPRTEAAASALAWIVQNDEGGADRARAVTRLLEEHAGSEVLGDLCMHFERDFPGGKSSLLSIFEKSPHRDVKGKALYHLAAWHLEAANLARTFAEADEETRASYTGYYGDEAVAFLREASPDELRAEAERLYERVVAEFADVENWRGTLADAAKGALFELRHLQIGMIAPDIEGEDIDGVPFKLSDYRGKVVVLDFWGDW